MAQEFFSLPSYPGYSPNPVEAVSSVPPEGLLQILVFASWLEIVGNKGKVRGKENFEAAADCAAVVPLCQSCQPLLCHSSL